MMMLKEFPYEYNFFPETYHLPYELEEFEALFDDEDNENQTFIMKPEVGCKGKGIFLMQDLDEIYDDEEMVAQRYIANPYLIDGLKFDLRIYVLLYGVNPLHIYIYDEGMARFATEIYQYPTQANMDNMFMHLTNYSINNKARNYE